MISIARTFGAPVSVPAGKPARNASIAVSPCAQLAVDLADQVQHVRIPLDHHELGDAHRSVRGDAADVVASEIDEHQMLGALLLVVHQLFGHARVVLGATGRAAASRRSDEA